MISKQSSLQRQIINSLITTSGAGVAMEHNATKYLEGKTKIAMRNRVKSNRRVKQANLSRAAKGAIGLPIGVMGAAALAPGHLFGDIGHLTSGGAGKLADPTVGQKITEVLADTGSRIGFNPHMNTDIAMLLGLAGLSGLGAGAGKLSERVIPIAKAPITRAASPAVAAASGISAEKKAAIIAALLASGGGGYLLGKNSSDS